MAKRPIIIIEDDKDDYELLLQIFNELNVQHPVTRFSLCQDALDFLRTTDQVVFIIICDINIPAMSGIKMRSLIDEDEQLKKKSIPFVFYSTAANKHEVEEAYDMIIQGFFIKGNDYAAIKHTVATMLEYWRLCVHPNQLG